MKLGELKKFQKKVWEHYRKEGRHDLPWRQTKNPYHILVSEIMLQQTQVERVEPYYRAWIKKFPTPKKLAEASLANVLKQWQGLGYNRRAKMLQMACKEVVRLGTFPKTVEALEKLPGIGPYTARAVCAFAFNQDVVCIETNIRTVILHHFFTRRNSTIYSTVSDGEIVQVLERVHPRGKSREWYAALMDYGSHLKRTGVRVNKKAKTYTKQSIFRGSNREARGAVIKELTKGRATKRSLTHVLGDDRIEQVTSQIRALTREGLVEKIGTWYRLPV